MFEELQGKDFTKSNERPQDQIHEVLQTVAEQIQRNLHLNTL